MGYADQDWLRELAELISDRQRPAAGEEISILALLAKDPRSGLIELAPGVYTVNRSDGGDWGATR